MGYPNRDREERSRRQPQVTVEGWRNRPQHSLQQHALMRHAQRLDDLKVYDLKRILKLLTLLLQTLDGGRGHLDEPSLWGPHGLTKKHKTDSDSCRRNDMPRCTRYPFRQLTHSWISLSLWRIYG